MLEGPGRKTFGHLEPSLVPLKSGREMPRRKGGRRAQTGVQDNRRRGPSSDLASLARSDKKCESQRIE